MNYYYYHFRRNDGVEWNGNIKSREVFKDRLKIKLTFGLWFKGHIPKFYDLLTKCQGQVIIP